MSDELRTEVEALVVKGLRDYYTYDRLTAGIMDLVREWHNAQLDKFASATDELAQLKAKDADTATTPHLSSYREGAAYGMWLCATRALRMKLTD